MAEAHASYSGDFDGSCVEADTMVALAQDLPGLIGARLTGGGFAAVPSTWWSRATPPLSPRPWVNGTRPKPASCRDSHLPRFKRRSQAGLIRSFESPAAALQAAGLLFAD